MNSTGLLNSTQLNSTQLAWVPTLDMLEQRINAGRAKVDPLRRVLHVIVHRVQLGERAASREFRHVLSHNYIYI